MSRVRRLKILGNSKAEDGLMAVIDRIAERTGQLDILVTSLGVGLSRNDEEFEKFAGRRMRLLKEFMDAYKGRKGKPQRAREAGA